jgi:6-pyruvoyltetrahydropterin/6-carboxytetrahydropterin synthase
MNKTITKEFQWDCAHRLHNGNLTQEENVCVFGKCHNTHGHTYKMFITVGRLDNSLVNGMIINFIELKKIVNELIVERFDHTVLNDDPLYSDGRLTTCENQIDDIWDLLDIPLQKIGILLAKIKLYETPTSYATLTR